VQCPEVDIEAGRPQGSAAINTEEPSSRSFLPNSVRNLVARIQGKERSEELRSSRGKREYGEGTVSRSDLVALHRRIMVANATKLREECFWAELCQKYFHLQDDLAAAKDSSRYVYVILLIWTMC